MAIQVSKCSVNVFLRSVLGCSGFNHQ